MNKPIYETIKTYGSNSETTTTKTIVGYKRVTRNGFSRKKKPISMIKALKVIDRMEQEKIFYDSEAWLQIQKEHFKDAIFLAEEGSGDMGIQSNHPLPNWMM